MLSFELKLNAEFDFFSNYYLELGVCTVRVDRGFANIQIRSKCSGF